jgi:hypothetical protein
MPITPSYLRDNLYSILDQAVETGSSPEIIRNGVKLRIVADQKPDVFSRLEKHPKVIKGTPESIIHTDWSQHWHHDLP